MCEMVTPDIMVCNIHLLISIVHSTLCNHPTAGWGFPNCIQAMQGNAMQLHSSYRNCHRAVLLCFSHCHSSNYSENFEVAWSHQKWRCLVMMACSSLLCQFFLSLLAMCHIHSGMICSWATPCQYGKATWICRGTCISSYIQGWFVPIILHGYAGVHAYHSTFTDDLFLLLLQSYPIGGWSHLNLGPMLN